MEKWAIRPDPAPHDPKRHVLLLKGTMVDVTNILKKFGAMCGRPTPAATVEGFNFSLALHGATKAKLDKLDETLSAMGPAASSPAMTAPVDAPLPPPPAPALDLSSSVPPSLPEMPTLAPPTLGGAAEPPTLGGPTLGGPTLGGPTLGAPTLSGPTLGEPALGGPTLGEPAFSGPTLGGLPPAADAPALGGLPPAAEAPPQLGLPAAGSTPAADRPAEAAGLQPVEIVGPPPESEAQMKAATPSEAPPSMGLQPVEIIGAPPESEDQMRSATPGAAPEPQAPAPLVKPFEPISLQPAGPAPAAAEPPPATLLQPVAPPPAAEPPNTMLLPAAPPPVPVPTQPPSLSAPPPVPLPAAPPPVPVPTTPPPVAAAPAPTPAPPPAAAPTPAPTLSQPPAPAPVPVPAAPPSPAPAFVQPSEAAKPGPRPLWGLLQPLDPGHNFDSLQVGSYNRFAHAAATSVVSAPGTMYNPLFLYGAPGAGKTHVAQSIAKALALQFSDEAIISTSGSRLSSAVTQAMVEKKWGELEAVLQKSKALIVDDVHLLAVTEGNRGKLADVMAMFFKQNLQVVLTSIYPPRALGSLEEALKISFGKGWSVDLKIPNPTVQAEIIRAYTDRIGCQLNGDEARRFLELIGQNYFDSVRWARRLKRFIELGKAVGRNPTPADVMPVLFDPGVKEPTQELPSSIELGSVASFKPPPPTPTSLNLAFLLPKGSEAMAPWVAARFFQTAAELSVTQTYRPVLVEYYDAQQPFGVPFQIGEHCWRAGAQAVIVVGPPADSQLAAREAEFQHAVARILDGLDVPLGWLRHRGTTALPNFLRAHLDLLKNLD